MYQFYEILILCAMTVGVLSATPTPFRMCTTVSMEAYVTRNATKVLAWSGEASLVFHDSLNMLSLKRTAFSDPQDITNGGATVIHFDNDEEVEFDAPGDGSTTHTNASFVVVLPTATEEGETALRLLAGVLDGGFFTPTDGSFYDGKCRTENPSMAFNYSALVRICCTAFASVPAPSPQALQCRNFRSRAILYSDKHTVAATVGAHLVFANGTAYIFGSAIGFGDKYAVSLNGDNSCGGGLDTFNCSMPFAGDQNGKLFITGMLDWQVGSGWNEHEAVYDFMMGRVIVRDGFTYMDEGVPFSAQDNCAYFFHAYAYSTYTVSTEICCEV